MNRNLTLPLIAALCFAFAGSYVFVVRPRTQHNAPPIPPPQSSVLSGEVAGVGLVEPASENISLSCPVSGMVTEVYVKAGDQIMKGQRLFSVDDRDTRAALAVRQAALLSAQANLARLESEPRPEEIPPAEARVAAAKAAADDASVQVRLIESVTDRRAVREEDIERRRAALAQANARVVEAEKSLSLLKAGAWGPDLQVARISVKQAQAAVEQSQIDLERLTSLAPINGVVLQNHVRVGQYASCAGTSEPLMIIGSSGALHLRVDISENDAWRVKEGASGTAYVRGNAALHYPVTFVRTEPYVLPKHSLTGDATERVDTRVLQVIYRFDDATAHLFVGQQMDLYVRGNSAVEQVSATRPVLAGGR